ncbi:MAG: homocysteine S-methyltransferase [Planctomycetota bacterium]|jgi:homocysteine S-methyltransferase
MTRDVKEFLRTEAPFLLDGGMATELEARGAELDHALWSARLLADDPQLIKAVHKSYIEAGARIISTATYQLNHRDLELFGWNESLFRLAVELAEEAVRAIDHQLRSRILIAASLGPFGASYGDGSEYTGDYRSSAARELIAWHLPRIECFLKTTADLLAFETIPNIAEAEVITDIMNGLPEFPYWVSFQLSDSEHLASGQRLADAVDAIKDAPGLRAIGFNCLSPSFVGGAISIVQERATHPILVYPNSGESYESGTWIKGSESATILELAPSWLAQGITAVGGCCRVGPKKIRQLGGLLT